MQTFSFRVTNAFKAGDETFEEGDIFEVSLPLSEYDAFKAKYPIERYFGDPIPFTHGRTRRLDGKASERMKQIRDTVPGAKNMFRNAEFQPTREF